MTAELSLLARLRELAEARRQLVGNDVQVSVEASDDVERPGFHRQRYTAFVPAETDMVVPLLSGWSLGYGELLIDPEPGDLLWGGTTNQFGVGQVSVLVVGLSAGPTPEFKQASILVTLGLRDQGGDDYWFGSVDYTLLCLDLVDE